ncbi:hypothetical protein A7A08_01553 [Methyloligella halotolerans]|uniref:Uncharacterized protein n=1 Tax=Methyloligella halotolerans TaxID=1177755 RepID=A0A1E2RZN0_9HYPH|nr:hypothetical protein [Methyloligella halotolerans]ODA67519.1 hypothetical protein A7A08_01553 [Methyloligella halotolerans]
MDNVREFLDFVKGQTAFHQRQAEYHAANPKRSERHQETAAKFAALADYLDLVSKTSRPDAPRNRLALSWDEIEGLPEELLSELNITESDKTEFNIASIVEEAGGVISLDRLLVEYYRLTGEVMKRSQMNNRLYRMGLKGLIYSVPSRKGVYSNYPMTEEEAANLL